MTEAQVPTFISAHCHWTGNTKHSLPPTFTRQPLFPTLTFCLSQHEPGLQNFVSISCLAVQWRKGPAAWLQFWDRKKPVWLYLNPHPPPLAKPMILPQGSAAFQPHGNPGWEHSWRGWDMFQPYTQQAHETDSCASPPGPGRASFRSSFTTRRGFSLPLVFQWGLPASPAHQQQRSWKQPWIYSKAQSGKDSASHQLTTISNRYAFLMWPTHRWFYTQRECDKPRNMHWSSQIPRCFLFNISPNINVMFSIITYKHTLCLRILGTSIIS